MAAIGAAQPAAASVEPDAALGALIDGETDEVLSAVLELWRNEGKLSAPDTHDHLKHAAASAVAAMPLSRIQRACSKATKTISKTSGLLEHLQQLRRRRLDQGRDRSDRAHPAREFEAQRRALQRGVATLAAAMSAVDQAAVPITTEVWVELTAGIERNYLVSPRTF